MFAPDQAASSTVFIYGSLPNWHVKGTVLDQDSASETEVGQYAHRYAQATKGSMGCTLKSAANDLEMWESRTRTQDLLLWMPHKFGG